MKLAVAFGSADCVFDDAAAFFALGVEPDLILACNDAIPIVSQLDVACSLHGDRIEEWLLKRELRDLPPAEYVYTKSTGSNPNGHAEFPQMFPGQHKAGSSGMFCVRLALGRFGADKVILCGIPMDRRLHITGGQEWEAWKYHRDGWHQAMPHINDKVRSMSGWTQKLLGAPDEEWLRG